MGNPTPSWTVLLTIAAAAATIAVSAFSGTLCIPCISWRYRSAFLSVDFVLGGIDRGAFDDLD